MTALAIVEPESRSTDPLVGWLDDVLDRLGAVVGAYLSHAPDPP